MGVDCVGCWIFYSYEYQACTLATLVEWTIHDMYDGSFERPFLKSIGYLFNARDADEKVRKLRVESTVQMLRVSWDKSTSPIIWFLLAGLRPSVSVVRELFIEREVPEAINRRFPTWNPKTRIKIYYHGTENELKSVNKILLHFPGGGFVTMSPENHEEYIRRWARHLGKSVCIVSVDYGKVQPHIYANFQFLGPRVPVPIRIG